MTTYCIIPDELARADAACAVAAGDLRRALSRIGNTEVTGEDAQVTIEVRSTERSGGEGFEIEPLASATGLRVSGAPAGAAYGLVHLAERLVIDGPDWQMRASSSPVLAERMFSETGQLLCLPDWGFWSEQPPYVDEAVLDEEIDELKRLAPHLVRNRFNALCIMHMNVDAYIDYRYFERPVLREHDRHFERSKIFCARLTELVEHFHRHHIRVYLQVYEFSYPHTLAEHPLVETFEGRCRFFSARYREFFERVPCDGIVMTLGEPHARTGYLGKHVVKPISAWEHDAADAAPLADFMQGLIGEQLGKRFYLRLWGYCTPMAIFELSKWRDFIGGLKSPVRLASKCSNGDFWIHQGESPLFHEPSADGRIAMFIFDAWQYEGWGRIFCFPQDWRRRLRLCGQRGVDCANYWANWGRNGHYSGSATPADWPVMGSWRGHASHHHQFTRGFTPGEAQAYLFARLAWDPQCSVERVASDWATLHYGHDNAPRVREILELSEIPCKQMYLRGRPHEGVRAVTSFYYDPDRVLSQLLQNTLEEVEARERRVEQVLNRMTELADGLDDDTAPNPEALSALRRGVRLGQLYFGSLTRYVTNLFREHEMVHVSEDEKEPLLSAIRSTLDELDAFIEPLADFEPEASDWNLTASPKDREIRMVTLKDRVAAMRDRWGSNR